MSNYIIKTPPYVGEIKYGYPVGTPCEISAEDLKTLKAAGVEIIKESEQEVPEQDNAPLTVIKAKKGK